MILSLPPLMIFDTDHENTISIEVPVDRNILMFHVKHY